MPQNNTNNAKNKGRRQRFLSYAVLLLLLTIPAFGYYKFYDGLKTAKESAELPSGSAQEHSNRPEIIITEGLAEDSFAELLTKIHKNMGIQVIWTYFEQRQKLGLGHTNVVFHPHPQEERFNAEILSAIASKSPITDAHKAIRENDIRLYRIDYIIDDIMKMSSWISHFEQYPGLTCAAYVPDIELKYHIKTWEENKNKPPEPQESAQLRHVKRAIETYAMAYNRTIMEGAGKEAGYPCHRANERHLIRVRDRLPKWRP